MTIMHLRSPTALRADRSSHTRRMPCGRKLGWFRLTEPSVLKLRSRGLNA
jgi:hypothetical protein